MQPFFKGFKYPVLFASVILLLALNGWAAQESPTDATYTKVSFDQVNADLSRYQDKRVELEVYYGRPFTREECSLILVFGLLDINQYKDHDWFIFTKIPMPLQALPDFIQPKEVSAGMGAVPPDKKEKIAEMKLTNGDKIRIRGVSIYKVKEIKNNHSTSNKSSSGTFQSKTNCPLIDIESIEKIEE